MFAYHNNKSVSCLESCQGCGSFPDSSCCSFTGRPIKRRASSLTVRSLYFSRRSPTLLTFPVEWAGKLYLVNMRLSERIYFWQEINTRIGSSTLVWRKHRYWDWKKAPNLTQMLFRVSKTNLEGVPNDPIIRGGGGKTSISISAPFVSLKFTFTCFLLTDIRLSVTKIKHLWMVSKAITEFNTTFCTFFF